MTDLIRYYASIRYPGGACEHYSQHCKDDEAALVYFQMVVDGKNAHRSQASLAAYVEKVWTLKERVLLDKTEPPLFHYTAKLRWIEENYEFMIGTQATSDAEAIAYYKRTYVDRPIEARAELLELVEDTQRAIKLEKHNAPT